MKLSEYLQSVPNLI